MGLYINNKKISNIIMNGNNSNGSDSTIINKSDLVIDGKTSFSENDCIGRSLADNGKLRIKANGKYYYFNIPKLHSIDNSICDTLNKLLVTKKVNKMVVDEFGNYGMKYSYSTSHVDGGYFWLTIKDVDSKQNGFYKHNSNFIESIELNQWKQILLKINLSFFENDEVPTTTAGFVEYMKNNPKKKFAIYYEMNNPYQYTLEDEPILIDKCDSYEIIDVLFKSTVVVKSNSLTLDKKIFDSQFLLSDDRRTRYASEFGCSYSDKSSTCSGTIDTNRILVKDLYYLDFEVGQGIAIENALYIRENELSWLCAEITDIDYSTGYITISRNLQATVSNVVVEHDNFIPYLKISSFFMNRDAVNLKFESGTYLDHALRTQVQRNNLPAILSEHNLQRPDINDHRIIIIITKKMFVNIDFQGSVFKEVAKWNLLNDYDFGGARCAVLPYTLIQIIGCDKVTMKNGTVIHDSENNCIYNGVKVGECMGHGFMAHGCKDILLENLEAYGCESDGICLGGSEYKHLYWNEGTNRSNLNITLKNCRAYHCGRQGLTFSAGADGIIDNCDFSYTGYCKDGVTKSWWGNRNPGAGIDFEYESYCDSTAGWTATSAIRRIRVTNTTLAYNNYALANGMTEGNFLMENCVIVGNPTGVFLIKTGANAGFLQRPEEDEGETYVHGYMQPITCILRDCLIDQNGVVNKCTFGAFKRVIIDNCVLRNFRFDYGGRQFSIINSDLQYTDGIRSHMQGYPRFPLIQNCTVRFRKEFIDEWEKSNQWGWSPVYGQFQDCIFYLEEPTAELGGSRKLLIDFGKNSQRNYVYPAKAYDFSAASLSNSIIRIPTVDWGDRTCYEVYSAKESIAGKLLYSDKVVTDNITINGDSLKTNFIIDENFNLSTSAKGNINVTIRTSEIDYYVTLSPNRTSNITSLTFNFWTVKNFVFEDGTNKLIYAIPEELKNRGFTLHIVQNNFNELVVDVRLLGSENSVFNTFVVPVNITLSPTKSELIVGDTLQLNASATPADIVLTYSSNASEIASVDNNGLVTALATGSATITVSDTGNKVSKTCTITVTEATQAAK